jgi:membrane protein DedA with SNARE-associated domain
MGIRAAAFLTAGIARVPFWKFLAVDAAACCVSIPIGFFLGYLATDQLERIMSDIDRIKRLVIFVGLILVAAWFVILMWRQSRRE